MFRRSASVIVTSIFLTATLLAVTVSSCHSVLASQDQEPIEIVSVLGPVGPVNPGGPGIEIILKNVGVEPVISLTATLGVYTAFGTSVDFTFDNVSPSNPLQPNRSTSAELTVIGGGFVTDNVSYPLTINGTLQDGEVFSYTKLVQIEEPLLDIHGIFIIRRQIWGLVLAGAICALFPPPHVALLGILVIIFVSEYKTQFATTSTWPLPASSQPPSPPPAQSSQHTE
jgi:hypothetical protein